jgi:predicted phage terminase large subunit-like protein
MNKKQKTITTEEEAIKQLDDPVIRKAVTKSDFFMFFTLYFSHHIKYAFAPMHREMMAICQNSSITLGLIMAFRGSGKSTIITTAFPLWSILGIPQNKFIVIVAKTKPQAKLIMNNIKAELESNNQLKNDLGPFQEISDEWGSETIVFSKQNARITVVSIEQSLKGLRHRQHRPDLIILDDIEDNESTKTKEMREKTYDKYKREIVPLGDLGTRIIHVGNMLHDNSLIMRLSREIKEGDSTRVFKKYPIVDDDSTIYWPSKFPTLADIETERLKVNDDVAWHLEYLLKVISGNGQIIKNEEIHYYIELPKKVRNTDGYFNQSYIVVGVDLAISKNDSADYTAIVPILYVKDEATQKYVAYVLKDFVHKRLDFNETLEIIISLNQTLKVYGASRVIFVIETVMYQQALPQAIKIKDKNYIEIIEKSTSIDKETRLRLTKPIFATQSIHFPEEDADVIINEIIGFGREKHDDLVDALMHSIDYAYGTLLNQQEVIIV